MPISGLRHSTASRPTDCVVRAALPLPAPSLLHPSWALGLRPSPLQPPALRQRFCDMPSSPISGLPLSEPSSLATEPSRAASPGLPSAASFARTVPVGLLTSACASSYYWSRTAGLICRLLRRVLFVSHGLMIYVDDLLCLLRKCASPLLSAFIVLLFLVLQVPMSWHKACLSSQPVWIGRRIDLLTCTVRMESAKQQRLLLLLQQVLEARHVPRHDVEKLAGKLLWLSGLVSFLRPTLAPLYALQRAGQTVMAVRQRLNWPSLCPSGITPPQTSASAAFQLV